MDIHSAILKLINSHGSAAKIENNGNIKTVKAFLEPLRYRYKYFDYSKRHFGGKKHGGDYLFICKPDNTIVADSTVIHFKNEKYIVKRCDTYYAKNKPVYLRAYLTFYTQALEDDYESDRETG